MYVSVLKKIVPLCALLTLSACQDNQSTSGPKADTVFMNGTIYTMNTEQPVVQAIAIDDGIIIATGDQDEIKTFIGSETKTIDLEGQTAFPGFFDLHVHPIFAGFLSNRCFIPQGSNLSKIQEYVKACVEKSQPGEWIIGGQWDASAIGQVPTKEMLDGVAPDNPVILSDTSEHSSWSNSKALEVAGVTSQTEAPPGGVIERDINGEPTGVFRESAIGLIRIKIPLPSDDEIDAALEWGLNEILSHGITSLTVASVGHSSSTEREMNAYLRAVESGRLKQRVRLCLPWLDDKQEFGETLDKYQSYNRENLRVDCAKVFLDGVPTDSHTAAMLDPYQGTLAVEDESRKKGMLLAMQNILDAALVDYDRKGYAVKFHAAGDAAVRAALDAVTAARNVNGQSGVLHDIGHCTFVAEEDIPRAKLINATYEVSPYLWAPSPINDSITAAIGQPRIDRVWPIKELLASGALVVPGSDWAVVPSVNPWIAVETLITRELPGGSENSFGKSQAIKLEQVFEMFTVNSAKHVGVSDKLGQLKNGMQADMIVISKDPFKTPTKELHTIKVQQTIIDGEVVYSGS